MLPLARFAVLLCAGFQAAYGSSDVIWKPDGYHVFPGGNIQEALDAAAHNATNKVVKIHAGTYRPKATGQALIYFIRAHNGIRVEAVGEVILSAGNPELSNSQDPMNPAIVNHVVYFGDGITETTVLQGVKITGANHFVTKDTPEIEPSAALKKNLFFYADGGAIKIFGRSAPSLQQLDIVDNYASPCAGGISIQQQWPEGDSRPAPVQIRDSVFRGNRSQITGAAVDLLPGSSAVISNCLFVGNIANLGVNYIASNPTQPEFTNSAPLTVFPTSRAVVQSCTFAANRNGVDDLGQQSVYRDCIFWHNDHGGAFYAGERYDLDIEGRAEVTGCVFGGPVIDRRGVLAGLTNIFHAADPQFDSRFQPHSPTCEGKGARSLTPSAALE